MRYTSMIICSLLYVINSIVTVSVTLYTVERDVKSKRLDLFLIVWAIITLVLPAILVSIVALLEIARHV